MKNPSIKKETIFSNTQKINKLKNILGIIIAVAAFCLYAQSISFNYANDDYLVLKENKLVQQGVSAIPVLLKTDRLFGRNDVLERMPEYRPAQMIVFAIAWQLFPDNPHVYHFINVLLYSLTCLLLFLLLCRLFKKQNLIIPFLSALFFALHPIHTEVVDNIKGLDEILCFLFALLAVWCFVKETEKLSIRNISIALIFFFLSLLSKETGIVYVVLIPLILFVFTEVEFKKIIIITLFLAVVSGIYFFIRFKILETIPQQVIDNLHTPFINSLRGIPDFISQKATAMYILLRYILMLVYPNNLSYDYSISEIPIRHITSPVVLLGLAIYIYIMIYSFIKIRKKDMIAFAILFYLITLAPVSNIFMLINWTMADRYLYMPSLGYGILLSYLIVKICKADTAKSKFINLKEFIMENKLVLIPVLFIAGFYSLKTIARNPDWKNNLTLFSHDVKIVPNSAKAHYFYGNEMLLNLYPSENNIEKKNKLLDDAIIEYQKAVAIYQDIPYVYQYLAKAFYYKGDYINAISNYETAIQHYAIPDVESFSNLGLLYLKTEQYDKALNMLDSAIKYNPEYTDARINKTSVLIKRGKYNEALAECDYILKYDSTNEKAQVVKGIAYLNLKNYTLTLKCLNAALAIDSSDVTCLKVLGITYQSIGDTVKANQFFERENKLLNQ